MTKTKKTGTKQADDLRRRAEEIAREKAAQSSEDMQTLSPEETRQMLHELRVHQIELEMQNEELRRAQEGLKAPEARYRTMGENANEAIVVVQDGMFKFVNRMTSEITGYSVQELTSRPFSEFIHPEDRDMMGQRLLGRFKDDVSQYRYSFRLTAKNGSIRWVEINAILIEWQGRPATLDFLSDITDRKLAEEALKKSSQLLRDTGEMAKVGGWELDLSTKEVLWTEEVGRIHGVEPGYKPKLEEALNFYAPESRPAVEEVLKKAAETGEPYDLESLFIPSGSKDKIWVRSLGKAVYSGGKIVKLAGTFQNIDKYKRAEEALRESEEKLRVLFDQLPIGVSLLDQNRKMIYANPALEKILAISRDDLLKDKYQSRRYIRPDGTSMPPEEYASIRAFQEQQPVHDVEIGVITESGQTIWTSVSAAPFPVASKGVVLATIDITERKRVEEALQQSEVRFRELFNRMSSGVAVYEAIDNGGDFIFRDFNPAAEKIEKVSRKDILGERVSEAFPGVKAFGVFEVFQRVWQTGKPEYYPENIYKDEKDPGSWRESWVFKLPTGEIVAIYNDITERRQAEILERAIYEIARAPETAKSLDDLYQSVHLIIKGLMPAENFYVALYDEKENLLYFPYFVDEIDKPPLPRKSGKGLTEYVLHTGRALLWDAALGKKLNRRGEAKIVGVPSSCWLGVPLKAGDKTIGVIALQHYSDPKAYGEREKQVLEYVSVQVANAIKRKQAEEAMQQSMHTIQIGYRLYEQTVAMISDIVWRYEVDAQGQFVRSYISPVADRLLGLPAGTIGTDFEKYFAYVHPDDIAAVKEKLFAELRERQKMIDTEYRLVKPDGTIIWALSRGSAHAEDNGNIVGFGTTGDITVRKKIEEELQESEEKYRTLITKMQVALEMHEGIFNDSGEMVDYRFLELNESFEMLTGLKREQVIGKTFLEILPGAEKSWIKKYAQVVKTGKPLHDENYSKTFDKYYEVIAYRTKPNQFATIFFDITQRIRSEKALRESERNIMAIMNASTEAILLIDKKGNILTANDEFCRRFTIIPGIQTGINIYNYLPKEVKQYWRQWIERSVKSGQPVRFEDNHSGRFFLNSVYPVLGQDGNVIYLAVFEMDISKRKDAEEALKKSEVKYRTLLNASPDGIIITDLKGRITDVSEIGLELYGTDSRNDVIGKHFLRFVPTGLLIKIREIIEKTQNEGLAQNIELTLKKKNQSFFISEISTTLIQEPDGTPMSFMIIVRDISQRKKLEKQQIHADRMTSLGEMASGIAHEINQPLNTISIIIDNILLEASKNNSLSNNYLQIKSEKIFENIFRIGNIIDHIRVFSRSQDDYIISSFNINDSINNAISMIAQQLRHKAIDLVLHLDKKIPSVLGNTYKFEQVILNLIINAKDALEEKKKNLHEDFPMFIEIGTFNDDQNILVKVEDNGIGIKDEDIDNVMLPFYSTKDSGMGTGLGLSITFGIIKDMKGNIEIQSEVLKGTKILITLPILDKK
ncbi:MAG: PAS domain S-box protein [Bacteroidetes bacterium]|nr:PAS domain S-box protein [Bacteroidota bacterium]